jgi:chorismate dehydratase
VLRIGQIPYLNCEPFFAHLDGVELVPLTPRRLGEAMSRGELDAAPLSLMDLLRQERDLVALPFGIATPGPARSVLLFSDRPAGALGGATIGITDETSTSVELLKVLLGLKHGVAPHAWVDADAPADAVLLIGDRAIRRVTSDVKVAHVIDIGQEWVEWTGRPCVFARWGIRAAVPGAERARFEQALGTALDRGMASVTGIAARRRDTGFTADQVDTYLHGFHFRFGPAEEGAIGEFRRLRAFLAASPTRAEA